MHRSTEEHLLLAVIGATANCSKKQKEVRSTIEAAMVRFQQGGTVKFQRKNAESHVCLRGH